MSRLSDRDRLRLVELLRCAADNFETGWMAPRSHAASAVAIRLYDHALEAERSVTGCNGDRAWALLEAAQRVEEGSWP
jgi:hypothetical protein